jgi:excisionase family DNA binding protein
METSTAPQLFRVNDVCARLAMSRSAVYREISAGHLKAIRIGSSLRISEGEIVRFVAQAG